ELEELTPVNAEKTPVESAQSERHKLSFDVEKTEIPPIAPESSTDQIDQPETTSDLRPDSEEQLSSADRPVEFKPEPPVAVQEEDYSQPETALTAWKMEPVELPSDMELVETRPDALTQSEETPVELQPARRPRHESSEAEETPSDEPLIQIETQTSQPGDRVDNP
ncbi:MAG: hypothetical protein GTO41_17860, partial [Burkholderiales bacterium]|nr:hypothetical protein [Burkholderiales bacterium]